MTRWLSLTALHLVLIGGVPVSAAVRVAVLADRDPVAERVAALLEPALADAEGVQLVERGDLRAVLREQEFQAGFAANAVEQRVKLGRLLRADLLVMLRVTGGPEKHFDLVVSETRQGLRLLAEPVPPAKDVEADAAGLRPRAVAAVKRFGQPVTAIVAVPPFVCDDFAFAFAADGAAYARVIEQALVARAGVVVVELAEARAVALELAVAGQPGIDRPLPSYLTGSYHNTGSGETRRFGFTLTLKQGDRVVATVTKEKIAPAAAARSLREAADGLLDPRPGRPPAPPDPRAEAAELYDRGSLFLRLGQPDEALALCEASLLLQPTPAAHRDAAQAVAAMWLRARDLAAPRVNGMRSPTAERRVWEEYLPQLRVGLEHLEAYLKAGPIRSPNDPVISLYLLHFPADEAGPVLLRVARAKYDARVEDLTLRFARELRWSTLARPADRYALAVSLADTVVRSKDSLATVAELLDDIDPGKSPPELREALDRLAGSNNPLARRAALQMQSRLARGFSVLGDQSVRPPTGGAVDPAAGAAWQLSRLDLGIGGIDGIIPCGQGVDAVWGPAGTVRPGNRDTLYLLKADAGPRVVGGCAGVGSPVYDGRYLWAAGDGSHGAEVLVVDPGTEKTWTLKPGDGLPDEPIQAFAAAPLGAGMVCAAAQVNHDGARRTWIAILRFDPETGPAVVPLHEARLMRPPAGMSNTDPSVAFPPHAAVVLNPPGAAKVGPACVVAFRSGGTYYSVSFPNADALRSGRGVAVRHEPSLTHPPASADQGWDFDGGRHFWISAVRGSGGAVGELHACALGGAPRTAAAGIPTGALAVTPVGVYVCSADLKSLFRADGPEGPFRRCPLLAPAEPPSGPRQFARSNQYGLLLLAGQHAFRLADAGGHFLPWRHP